MTKDEILKAFEQLSAEDQQAVRTGLSEHSASSCCSSGEMRQHMESMMKMMHSSENPMDHCEQMMDMCGKMMEQKEQPATE